MKFKSIIFLIFLLLLSGCSSKNGFVIPPNGGAGIMVTNPMWISGIKEKNLIYSQSFPKPEENNFLKVVNAGYWLANTNGKISQLVYFFELNNKKFSNSKVYTRSSFTNPTNKNSPFVYEGILDNTVGSVKITHATVENVMLNSEYIMTFKVYSDSKRTNLVAKINQRIISAVDNTSGCIKLTNAYKRENFHILNPKGKLIPIDKLIIACERR